MKLPLINQPVKLSIKGKTCTVKCTDIFDGGFGYYFDAVFPKKSIHKFAVGEQCQIPGLGKNYLADFVSYPTGDESKVRFLILKW